MLQNMSRSMAGAGPLFQSSTRHWCSRDRGFIHLPTLLPALPPIPVFNKPEGPQWHLKADAHSPGPYW